MYENVYLTSFRRKFITDLIQIRHEDPATTSFTYTANGKRQTLDSNREFLKMENEQIKTAQEILMDKKMRENTNLCVGKKLTVGDKQRGNLVTWYKFAFAS